MIKANELRIGNFVTYNPASVDEGTKIIPLQIDAIDKEAGFILNDGFSNVYTEEEINPIPLTPELLEKWCGFKPYWEGSRGMKLEIAYQDERFPCSLQTSGDNKILVCRSGVYSIGAPCDYVHQLQNLIFSLTGEELSINLEAK